MRRVPGIALLGLTIAASSPLPASGQVFVGAGGPTPLGISSAYAAPGYYGTTYGLPGFGAVRTYSGFSSPYGVGYGYGYPPAAILPGRYGMGLWRPGTATADGPIYGQGHYNTFVAPYTPYSGFGPVPFGLYAPAFGPPYVSPSAAR